MRLIKSSDWIICKNYLLTSQWLRKNTFNGWKEINVKGIECH